MYNDRSATEQYRSADWPRIGKAGPFLAGTQQCGQATVAQESRKPTIFLAIESLNSHIEDLESAVSSLLARLSPVLGNETTCPVSGNGQGCDSSPPCSDLAKTLDEKITRLRQLTSCLRSALDRLEV